MRMLTLEAGSDFVLARFVKSALALALTALFSCLPGAAFAQAGAGSPAPTPSAADEPRFQVDRFEVEGNNPIGDAAAQRALQGFTGPSVSLDRLRAAAEALERALQEAGFGFYRVILPPQDNNRVVTLRVLSFMVGDVTVKGGKFFAEPNVRASLPALKEGASPNTLDLARDLALANENSAKRVVAAFRPGTKRDTVDANLEVTDSRPLSGFAQLSNTGTSATGITRLTFGVAHANLFDRDHQVTATYTMSPEQSSKVKQWGAFYRAPVYGLGGMISAYWTESNVQSGSAAGVAVTGGGKFGGLQYTQYFAPRGDYRDYVTLGIDFKQFDNSVLVAGNNAGTCDRIGSRPLTGSYSGRYEGANLTVSFNGDYVRNLPGGSRTSQSDYDLCNPTIGDPSKNLSAAWSVLRFGGDVAWRFTGEWLLAGRLRAQASGQTLIPGEKFGVGGAQSVRALGERALAGDGGVQASAELWLPFQWQGTRWLVFYDTGRVKTLAPVLPANSYESVSSVGFGMRWQYESQASLSLDYGVVVQGHANNGNVLNVQNTRGHNRLHVNLVVKF